MIVNATEIQDRSVSDILMEMFDSGYQVTFRKLEDHNAMRILVQEKNGSYAMVHCIEKKDLEETVLPDMAIKYHMMQMKRRMDDYRKALEEKK